jgi:hypothetical protein
LRVYLFEIWNILLGFSNLQNFDVVHAKYLNVETRLEIFPKKPICFDSGELKWVIFREEF